MRSKLTNIIAEQNGSINIWNNTGAVVSFEHNSNVVQILGSIKIAAPHHVRVVFSGDVLSTEDNIDFELIPNT